MKKGTASKVDAKSKKPKKTKRQKVKYPNLRKDLNLKTRRDYVTHHVYTDGVTSVTGEGEGIRALNDAELEWLNKFEGEYTNASVSQKEERLEDQLHNTKELAKDCTDRNNSRNRCLLNIAKSTNHLKFRSWEEFDQGTVAAFDGLDLEFAIIAGTSLLDKKEDDD